MTTLIVRFLNIVMAALIAGTLFGIWIGYNSRTLSATTYIEQQQSVIKALNTLMPLLGAITIILTITSAFLQKNNQTVFMTLLIAAGFLIISGLVTRFGNQPINSLVSSWDKTVIPGNWPKLRDKWWSFHIIRTLTALIALFLIVYTGMRKD